MRGSHPGESEHSGSGLEHMKAFHGESRKGSLGESLSLPPSSVGLHEQHVHALRPWHALLPTGCLTAGQRDLHSK